ncbi:hypothetical protein HPG69_003914, partial [Diceros bicornis minor]
MSSGLEAAGSDIDILTVNGILGESVTFPLNIQEPQQVVSIAWNSKTSVAFVVPGNSRTAPTVTVTHQNYYERINVSAQNYNLEISNLRMEDTGTYKADININTPETKATTITRHYNLQVYRRLGKPKITQSLMTSVNSTCNVTLTCSVEKEEKNVTYSWSPLGEEGNVLRIFRIPDNQELTYTCTAWNPVSNNSDSISSRQLCTDITIGLRTRHTGLLSSYLKTFSKNPVSRDARPAESRIYDEIPQSMVLPAKEEPVNTIYSIVQYSDKCPSLEYAKRE